MLAMKVEENLMEERVTKLESGYLHLREDMGEVKADIREIKAELGDIRVQMSEMYRKLRESELVTRIWLLLSQAAVLGVMARGFKWL